MANPTSQYTINETLYEGRGRVVYRALRNTDHRPVVLKVLDPRSCRPKEIERLKSEYATGESLNIGAVVRPLALETYQGMPALVLEDFGAQPLDRMLGAPMEIGRFLELAVRMARAVSDIHEQGLIHKDLKPANILVNPATGEVKIADFGVASRLPAEQTAPQSPSHIEGSLPYLSPEQTGRVNRSIDSRSDLYALGITFYQMLTGRLPFEARDPLEWVHCHIARTPRLPSELTSGVPTILSRMVLKLLAKMADDRYQTARGLQQDLERSFAQWNATGKIEPFPLGEQDVSDRFQIPQKLYGRDEEVAALFRAFDRVVEQGMPELVLVSGYSGIGKSSLVHELHKPVVLARGFFVSGKVDQYKRDIPYASVAHALGELVQQVLTEADERIAVWKADIQKTLGINGRIVVDLVPQIELIIGPQSPVPDLGSADAQKRFDIVFQDFLDLFATREHPMVLFLDDLQWLDRDSLRLIEYLFTNPATRYLLLIGAYRDNEVSPSHPLMTTLDVIRRGGTEVRHIRLEPLSRESLSQLLADTLRCEESESESLAQLVFEKTGGNPFFFIQFLTMLHREGLLEFDHERKSWTWDIKLIRAKSFTDNVVELMVGKLKRLPSRTQDELKLASCLGDEFDLGTLALIGNDSKAEAERDLREAVREGLLPHTNGIFRFLHDRVHQAAYSLIPEDQRAALHLKIGQLLLANLTEEQIDEKVFDVAGHLNRGAFLLASQDEKNRVAALNLRAGRKAKSATAYPSALTYLSAGQSLLASDSWRAQHELTYGLHIDRARCEWLSGHFEAAADLLEALTAHARSRVDQSEIYRVKIDLHTTRGEYEQGSLTALAAYSKLFGVELAVHPTQDALRRTAERVLQELGQRSIDELLQLPTMTDPEMKAAVALISASLPSAYFTDPNLHDSMCCELVRISLRYGNIDSSPHGYVTFGALLGWMFERREDAVRFGRLAHDLIERYRFITGKPSAYFTIGNFISFWIQPVRDAIQWFHESFQSSLECGDVNHACYAALCIVMCRLMKGDPLAEVAAEAERQLDFTHRTKYRIVHDAIVGVYRLVQNLRGQTWRLSSYDAPDFDQDEFESSLAGGAAERWKRFIYYSHKGLARLLSGDYEEAIAASIEASKLIWAVPRLIPVADYYYVAALSLAAQYDQVSREMQKEYLETMFRCQEQCHVYQRHCPESFFNRYALVSAEIARITGKDLEAMGLYEEAIRSARENGFVQNEAMGNELAAKFYRNRGFESVGDYYLREARSCYERWGAVGKVKQIDQCYPRLFPARRLDATATFAAQAEQLDLLSVVKASQTVSREIVFDELLRTLLQVVLEQGGAQKVYLILSRHGDLFIEAEALLEEKGVAAKILQSVPLGSELLVPSTVINYVARTKESVILDNAADSPKYGSDPYIARVRPRSVLCLPILRQAEVVALLYLENNLTTQAFTPERLSALELLATQAAISLENALLLAREQGARVAAEAARVEAEVAERRLAFLAHELKTPLTTLRLRLEILKRSTEKEETVSSSSLSSSLVSIKRQFDLLTELINSLLDLSSIQRGRLVLAREAVELTSLVQDVAGRLSEQAEAAGCVLHVQAARPIWGQWDRLRIEQVVVNLLTNALKYGGKKPVRIVADSDGSQARLSVSDQGIGIPEADQQRIFEPFERATDLHQGHSLGLGLYFVREAVRAHGGHVQLRSQPGAGTTVIVELPIARSV